MTSAVVPGLPAPGRCLVMGVVNVTPDSFSDGGDWFDADKAIRHGLELVAEGADVVDVGGESTRPGAQRVSREEELRRVVPVIAALSEAGVPVSVDTMRAEVAEAAVEAGARLVNDVSGGLADPAMTRLVAQARVPYVVMHWRGHSAEMNDRAVYDDVVTEVREELLRRVDAVLAEGVDPSMIVLDPGLGFAKNAEHDWALLAHMDALVGTGYPVLFGASRKRFVGRALAAPDGTPRPVRERDDATVAITALAAAAGAWCIRVHRVRANADAVRMAAAITAHAAPSAPSGGGHAAAAQDAPAGGGQAAPGDGQDARSRGGHAVPDGGVDDGHEGGGRSFSVGGDRAWEGGDLPGDGGVSRSSGLPGSGGAGSSGASGSGGSKRGGASEGSRGSGGVAEGRGDSGGDSRRGAGGAFGGGGPEASAVSGGGGGFGGGRGAGGGRFSGGGFGRVDGLGRG